MVGQQTSPTKTTAKRHPLAIFALTTTALQVPMIERPTKRQAVRLNLCSPGRTRTGHWDANGVVYIADRGYRLFLNRFRRKTED